ncbi:antitermination protein [Salmonella enterica subsp. enterica serovar Alachua]|nr:antitermination protein [Salmonella enterica subsp. enterica serovar Alachua]
MNQHDINYSRNEIRSALMDLSGGTKGQLEAFSEHPPSDKKATPRLSVNLVELEGEQGIRFVKSQAAPLFVVETRSRCSPIPPIKDAEYRSAPWRRVVNSLDEYQQAWIRYCYGFDLNFRYQTLMCEYVWNRYQAFNVDKQLQSRVIKKLVGLVWLAAQEVAATRNNESYKEYAGAALARMVTVDRSTWLRVYSKHWERLKAAFVDLDNQALHTAFLRYKKIAEIIDAKM